MASIKEEGGEQQVIIDRVEQGFDLIKSATGNKNKQIVLKDVMDNNLDAWNALYLLLNPLMSYHVGEKSLSKSTKKAPIRRFQSLDSMLYHLDHKRALSDQDIGDIWGFIESNKQHHDLIVGMLTKSITLGVTAKTVNKVAGYQYIPQFCCMLANKYYEHQDAVDGPFVLTEKFDGIRCLCVFNDGHAKFYSRQGQQIEDLVQIANQIDEVMAYTGLDIVFDGELLISNRDGMPSKEQYKQTTKIVRSNGEKRGITYHIFDVVDYDGFTTRQCKIPYYQRRQKLSTYLTGCGPHIEVVPVLYSGCDTTAIQRYVDEQMQLGHEGVMINMLNAVYEYKRTNVLLKCKVMQDADLLVIGGTEGTGKYANTLGALNVIYKGNVVGVGSGLSDELRHRIWNNPTKYIGKIATVQFFEQTQDADGNVSIRFPVFKCFRDDKTEESYN